MGRRGGQARRVLFWSTAAAITGLLVVALALSHVVAREAGDEDSALQVHTRTGGGVQAAATLHFTAPPAAVLAVLTNYTAWPNLFGAPLRLAKIERRAGGVLTDLYIGHPWWFGERRLLCETKELPGGRLVTSRVAGDFREYRRTWTIRAEEAGRGTRAKFELLVAFDTWVPDWLLAVEVKRQLEQHFRILREQAAARHSATRGEM